jgi:hypothetical protein
MMIVMFSVEVSPGAKDTFDARRISLARLKSRVNHLPKRKDTSNAEFLSRRANEMREKSQLPEAEADLNAILEKYGAFLRQTITSICPKDLGIQFDDIEREARLRLWRAIRAEREINFLLIKK